MKIERLSKRKRLAALSSQASLTKRNKRSSKNPLKMILGSLQLNRKKCSIKQTFLASILHKRNLNKHFKILVQDKELLKANKKKNLIRLITSEFLSSLKPKIF